MREAAHIVFALTPNSASCERVFALLQQLFDEEQKSMLADAIQAALMLNYIQPSRHRVVGPVRGPVTFRAPGHPAFCAKD